MSLHKANAIIGLPVIELEDGKQLGTVKDIRLRNDWTVHSLCVDQKRWFSAGKYIARSDVEHIGPDAVTVSRASVVSDTDGCEETVSFLEGEPNLLRRRVITRDGEQLGALSDVYLSSELDKPITGIEISEGLLADLQGGRKWLPLQEPFVLGEDAVIVPGSSRERLSAITF